jgi:hypothetical protein
VIFVILKLFVSFVIVRCCVELGCWNGLSMFNGADIDFFYVMNELGFW